MTELDPKTRQLSRHELSLVLDRLQANGGGEHDSSVEKTSVWSRKPRVEATSTNAPRRVAEPVTQLECTQTLAPKPDVACTLGAEQAGEITVRSKGARALFLRAGLVLVTVVGAAWLGIHSPLAEHKSSQRPSSSGTTATALVAAPRSVVATTPNLLSAIQAPSERVAVDQLISGHLHDALDSYRALALTHADQPAFAFVVAQLERELSACATGDGPCAR